MLLEGPRYHHTPVLLEEVLAALNVRPGGRYIDCTVGEGGHSAAILSVSSPGGQLLGLDADPEALSVAQDRLRSYAGSLRLIRSNFRDLEEVALAHGFLPARGILFDLGLSSRQLEITGRGFSFLRDEPLDMRFDPQGAVTAADLVNTLPEEELARLFREYGDESRAHKLSRAIVRHRPLRTTGDLVGAVTEVVPHRGRTHPATRVFQALRIAVNGELDNLRVALPQALRLLEPGGRLAAISYHSGEDRMVKEFMVAEARDCLCPPEVPVCVCGHRAQLRRITRKPTAPSPQEVEANPRSRSARLRVAERL